MAKIEYEGYSVDVKFASCPGEETTYMLSPSKVIRIKWKEETSLEEHAREVSNSIKERFEQRLARAETRAKLQLFTSQYLTRR